MIMAEVTKIETVTENTEAPAVEKKAPAKRGRKPATEKKEAAEKKTAAKPAAKTTAKKTSVKKAAEKAVETAVETVENLVEKAAEKKAAPKKTTTRKTAAKKAEPQANVVIQFAGKEFQAKEILEKAKAAFAKANEGVEIQSIELYVKPEENAAYYVVNGTGSDDYKIEL